MLARDRIAAVDAPSGSLVIKPQGSAALDALRAACGPLAVASPFARLGEDPAAPPPTLAMAGGHGRRTAKS